jgi:hypothetical protein
MRRTPRQVTQSTRVGSRRSLLRLLGLGLIIFGATGATSPPTALGRPADDGRAVVTMAGFRAHKDGRSTIYVEVTRPVPVESNAGGRELTFKLRGAKVTLRNNRNPLLAQHFSTVVESARLVSDANDVALEIKLRKATTPQHRLVNHPGGAATLEVEFPASGG